LCRKKPRAAYEKSAKNTSFQVEIVRIRADSGPFSPQFHSLQPSGCVSGALPTALAPGKSAAPKTPQFQARSRDKAGLPSRNVSRENETRTFSTGKAGPEGHFHLVFRACRRKNLDALSGEEN